MARDRIRRLGLDLKQRAGKLSGGQRAQLALTLGIAKRPELLILDEPVAALDPLARREFMRDLMEAVAEHEMSVVLSSHLVSDVERWARKSSSSIASIGRTTGSSESAWPITAVCTRRLSRAIQPPAVLETRSISGRRPATPPGAQLTDGISRH